MIRHPPSRAAPRAPLPPPKVGESVAVNLIAVLVAMRDERPCVLTLEGGCSLPSGPFELAHRSLQSGLRDWVEQQTHQPIGYVEQLYTFADRDRGAHDLGRHEIGRHEIGRMVSISYLGLTRVRSRPGETGSPWVDWYTFFPWEDRRDGRARLADVIEAALERWIAEAPDEPTRHARHQRCAVNFGLGSFGWNEDLVLGRYELLFEAGLIAESPGAGAEPLLPGRRMAADHRRILATGVARLRGKIKYRPVVFELLAPTFTLLQLQRCVEALAGRPLHKGNFRRLVEQQQLVEETGAMSVATGGRPAQLFRFRGDVLAERAVTGTKLPLAGG